MAPTLPARTFPAGSEDTGRKNAHGSLSGGELGYPTRNNRLLKYEVFEDEVRTRTVWYVYYETGHVSNIIVKDEGEGDEYDWYRGLCFTYWGLGHSLVGLALWDQWKDDGQGGFTDYEKLALREFRYHPNPRGRFMARDLDPNDQQWQWSTVGAEHWTDYDIPMPYGDFDVTFGLQGDPVETEQMRYLEGFGLPAQQTVSTGATRYLHGDLLDSTVLMTDDSGSAVASVAYTAFGERIGTAPETRYQYAGGWGYESDLLVLEGAPGTAPITLQHVGHRWYDPSIGRFLQRDPIGLDGGLNLYRYACGDPLTVADRQGLQPNHPKYCPYCGTTFRHKPWCKYYVPRPPRPPTPPEDRTLAELRRIKQMRIAVKGGAAALALTVGVAIPPVGIGIGLGLLCVEVYEEWTE